MKMAAVISAFFRCCQRRPPGTIINRMPFFGVELCLIPAVPRFAKAKSRLIRNPVNTLAIRSIASCGLRRGGEYSANRYYAVLHIVSSNASLLDHPSPSRFRHNLVPTIVYPCLRCSYHSHTRPCIHLVPSDEQVIIVDDGGTRLDFITETVTTTSTLV